MNEYITLGDNINPPVVNINKAMAVYDCVRTEEFDIASFNSLLLAIVTYLDSHGVKYGYKAVGRITSVNTLKENKNGLKICKNKKC